MPGDCGCPTRPRCWTVGRNEIADAVGDVAGSCPPLLFSCAGAAGDRNQCRCSLRGCRPSPPAAVAAVVVVSSPVRRGPPPARLPGSRWQQHGLPTFSGADGRTLPWLSASRSCPCSGGCPRVAWRSTTTCCFSSTGGQEQPPGNTGNNPPQPPPQRKAPWKPRQTCWRRCPCCAGSRRWRSWRSLRGGGVCRNGRQRRPTSAACSRVPTTRLQGETKHYGVFGG